MALADTTVSHTELVQRAQSGDRDAFGALYGSYLSRIYDFTLGMLRNRSDAEDATSATFLKAVERLGDLRDPAAFKGWLYTIARNEALRIVDARKRATPVAEHFETATAVQTAAMPHPEEHAERAELRALFDEAAATLSERDRSVFELTLRHGMSSSEVARVLRVRPAYAYILVNRLKGSITEALEAIILARTGRADCPELAAVVDRFGGEVSPRMRKAVSRHARGCVACGKTKRRRAALPVLLEGIAFAEPSATFAAELASHIDTHWDLRPQGLASSSGGGLVHMVGAAGVVIVIAGALLGIGAQRTLVDIENDAIRPAADTSEPAAEVAKHAGPVDGIPSGPASRDPEPAQPNTDDRGSRVSVTEGAGEGGSNDGDSRESNNADAGSGADGPEDGEDSGRDGGRSEQPVPPR